jgi:hypothetical protein
MSSPAETAQTNEFDAAKAIVAALKGLDRKMQERAIRFACDSIGITGPSSPLEPARPPVPTAGVPASTSTEATADKGAGAVDIKQFTASKAPKSDQQFVAVLAYYYRFEAPAAQRRDTINPKALEDGARLAGRRRPADAKATLFNARSQGYLDHVGNNEFRLNSVGENLVAMTLPSTKANGQPEGRGVRKKKGRGVGSKTSRKASGKQAGGRKKAGD